MLFNTVQFFIFFLIVYSLYVRLNTKWQNKLLLVASYFFYACWDCRALWLLYFSTIIDFFCGLKMRSATNQKDKKLFLILSICTHLLILSFFKYFNFFTTSFSELLILCGIKADFVTVNIILPIGISFYTFKSISYLVDLYRDEVEPTDNIFDFALFVSFFPALIAGPIDRAKKLLTQISNPRIISQNDLKEGLYLILWGLYEKVFIADNLSIIVNPVFNKTVDFNGVEVLIAVYAFAFQILCDFDGYSNMARGIAKLMGFHLMINFNLPYFVTNPSDFWKRWHISLSQWLRDYLYIPLGGNKRNQLGNLFITMLLGGLWHGAAWTYVIWGAYHGLLLIFYRVLSLISPFSIELKSLLLKRLTFIIKAFVFFNFVCIGWLFFRANTIEQAISMLSSLLFNFDWIDSATCMLILLFSVTFLFLVISLFQFIYNDLLVILKLSLVYQIMIYLFLIFSIILSGSKTTQEFIYFQF